jgi:hypothetical protein
VISAIGAVDTVAKETGICGGDAAPDVRAEGDSTAANLFNIIACLREHERTRLRPVA